MKTVALSTTAFFAYNPGNDVVRARYAKKHKINVDNVPKDPEDENMIAEFKQLKQLKVMPPKLVSLSSSNLFSARGMVAITNAAFKDAVMPSQY